MMDILDRSFLALGYEDRWRSLEASSLKRLRRLLSRRHSTTDMAVSETAWRRILRSQIRDEVRHLRHVRKRMAETKGTRR